MLVVVLIAAALGLAQLIWRTHVRDASLFFLGEEGNPLLQTHRLLQGAALHRDVAYQYGWSAYSYAFYARFFGNTINAMLAWHFVWSLINITLACLIVRKFIAGTNLLFAGLLVIAPALLVPGGMGAYLTNVSIPLERALILLFVLAWRPPAQRTWRGVFTLGVLLGVMQLVKFGGAAFLGAALLLVDVACIWLTQEENRWRRLLPATISVGGVFVLVQSLIIAMAFVTLPRAIARDVLWPAYVQAVYPGLGQLFEWAGWPFFIGRQVPLLAMVIAGVILLVRTYARRSTHSIDGALPSLFIPFCFYFLAMDTYIGHAYLVYHYGWTVAPAAAVGLSRVNWRPRILLSIAILPTLLLLVKLSVGTASPPDTRALTLANGETVYGSSAQIATYERMAEVARLSQTHSKDGFVLLILPWRGGSYHFFYNTNFNLRNHMMAPGFTRSYDEDEFRANVNRITAVLYPQSPSDPNDSLHQALRATFSEDLTNLVEKRLSADPPLSLGMNWRLRPAQDMSEAFRQFQMQTKSEH